MKSLMIVGVLATLSVAAHAQQYLTDMQIASIQAVCPASVKAFCDKLPQIRDAFTSNTAAPGSCNNSDPITGPSRINILVSVTEKSQCRQITLDCNNDQGAGLLSQVLSLVLCLVNDAGPLVQNTLQNVLNTVSARTTAVQVVLLIVYVLVRKLLDALCRANLDRVVVVVPLAVFILLVGVAYGLPMSLSAVSLQIVVLAVTLALTLLPLTTVAAGAVAAIPLGQIASTLSQVLTGLLNTPPATCAGSNVTPPPMVNNALNSLTNSVTNTLGSTLGNLLKSAFGLVSGLVGGVVGIIGSLG